MTAWPCAVGAHSPVAGARAFVREHPIVSATATRDGGLVDVATTTAGREIVAFPGEPLRRSGGDDAA